MPNLVKEFKALVVFNKGGGGGGGTKPSSLATKAQNYTAEDRVKHWKLCNSTNLHSFLKLNLADMLLKQVFAY